MTRTGHGEAGPGKWARGSNFFEKGCAEALAKRTWQRGKSEDSCLKLVARGFASFNEVRRCLRVAAGTCRVWLELSSADLMAPEEVGFAEDMVIAI